MADFFSKLFTLMRTGNTFRSTTGREQRLLAKQAAAEEVYARRAEIQKAIDAEKAR